MIKVKYTRRLAIAAAWSAGLTTFSVARAQDGAIAAPPAAEEVPLSRAAPFDRFCIAPLCADRSRAAPPVVVPLPRVPSTQPMGLAEREVRNALVRELRRVLPDVGGEWNHRPLRDLVGAVIAALGEDEAWLSRSQGLGSAAARVGIVARLEETLPRDSSCASARRADAIYEGLAMSLALSPLSFPESTGRVAPACVETARAAQRAVDAVTLDVAIPEAQRPPVVRAAAAFDVLRSCASDTEVGRALDERGVDRSGTFASATKTIVALRARPPSEAEYGALGACGPALRDLAALDPAPFDAASARGLAAVELSSLLPTLALPTPREPIVQQLVASGGRLTRADLVALVKVAIKFALGVPNAGIFEAAFAALADAVVEVDVAASSVSSAGAIATLDPRVFAATLAARYDVAEGGRPTLKSLLGLPPSPWIFDLGLGVPTVGREVNLVGDGRFGYEGRNLGGVLSGGAKYYELEQAGLSTDNTHLFGGVDGFFVSGDVRARLRFEARLFGGVDLYDTTTIRSRTTPAGSTTVNDYDSFMVRGALKVALRIEPDDRWFFRIGGGLGPQYETHDSTNVDARGVVFESPTSVTLHSTANALARFRLVPSVISTRLRADFARLKITREVLSFNSAATSANVVAQSTEQIELGGRLFVDADALAFQGFVPAAWAGVDYVTVSGVAPTSTLVPVIGLGVVRGIR